MKATFLGLLVVAACSSGSSQTAAPVVSPQPEPVQAEVESPPSGPITIAVVGVNDVHGHIEGLPLLAAYVAAIRAQVAGVVLLDGGDAFQGTLESNLNEGAAVIAAYNAIGFTAMAIGNHEFDFGPEGPLPVPARGEDPRGALRARIAEAKFPLLGANVIDDATGKPFGPASATVEIEGVKIGLIGLTTEDTPRTTMAANFEGLAIAPLAETAAAEARKLRDAGAHIVVITAHAGGRCRSFDDPADLSVCEERQEIFEVARALDPGLVDVIVAGHTHAGVAHEVNGIAIIESFKHATAFGRVDLLVDPTTKKVTSRKIHAPQDVKPGKYAGIEIAPDQAIEELLAPYVASAKAKREEKLGVTLAAPVTRAYGEESALGNLFTDLMLEGVPGDVAIANGGGLRVDLPAGELTYGALFESFPFDNRVATVTMTGAELERVVAGSLQRTNGILSLGGVTARARCKEGTLEVELTRGKKRIKDGDRLVIVTYDFLATGGDGAFGTIPADRVRIDDATAVRDLMADVLRKRGGKIDPAKLLDAKKPRLDYPGPRPVKCD